MGFKEDGIKAVYRVAGHKITKGSKMFVKTTLKKMGWNKDAVTIAVNMLDTEFGTAAFSYTIGTMLAHFPYLKDDPRMKKLQEEMKIEGMAVAGEAVFDVGMKHFMPQIQNLLGKADKYMPETKKFETETGEKFGLGDVQVAKKS